MTLTDNRKQELILDILLSFDFNRVHLAMVHTKWKWGKETPTVRELQRQAKSLLEDLASEKYGKAEDGGSIGTGGLTAYWSYEYEGRPRPALRFTMEYYVGMLEEDYEDDKDS